MEYRYAAVQIDSDLTSLLAVAHPRELCSAAGKLLERMGLQGFMISTAPQGSGRAEVELLSTLPEDVCEGFRVSWQDGADPVSRHVKRRSVPIAWETDELCRSAPAVPYARLKQLGIHAGWSVGARSEQGFSRIDIYSHQPRHFAVTDLQSDLLLFSCYLNDSLRALWSTQNPRHKAPILTGREQECLRWSASGKTSNEIGIILGISQNTVYFHLKKAASKFEVYGTRHAISRAMEMGLI